MLASCLACLGSAAQPARRIQASIRDTDLYELRGHVRPAIAEAQDQGQLDQAQPLRDLSVQFSLTAQGKEDLDQLLRLQQTKGSEQYHKFLTPEEFGARFGPSQDDIAKLSAWLESQGFNSVRLARSRMSVSFEGTAGTAGQAFHIALRRYRWKGESHYANASDPQLPVALRPLVGSVRGLNDFGLQRRSISVPQPRFTTGSNSHYLSPGDFTAIYNLNSLYASGLDGTGVRIAVPGASNIQLSDIRAFRAAAGLPPSDPQVIVDGVDPGLKTGDQEEADLDVEWAGGIAKGATIVFVTSSSAFRSLNYIIDNNLAPIVSLSYGICELGMTRAESDAANQDFQQANAQGITVIASSGDSGGASCDARAPATRGFAVDFPASSPYVTGIGGTTLQEGPGTYWAPPSDAASSASSYIPEIAWNDSNSTRMGSSGGGASVHNAKPVWQAGSGVVADGLRDVPDLAFAASPFHDPYLVCTSGSCVNGFLQADRSFRAVGGTSAGSPAFAGILALLVQKLGPQGNINPDLYTLAATAPEAFHDITNGNNQVTCQVGSTLCMYGTLGYSTNVGHDRVTGLGSADAGLLLDRWTTLSASNVNATAGPLSFIPVTPCRIADTRNAPDIYGGPKLSAGEIREFNIAGAACNTPVSAAAYALNVTVVPDGALNYLTVWPSGIQRPVASTLNSDGRIKANAAIIPAGRNNGVSVYATDATHVVIDISGYFVPPASQTGLQFYPLSPCRVADTRESTGGLGAPFLTSGQARDFPVLSSACGIPANAAAYSLNFTVVPHNPLLYMTAWPTGQPQPLASVVNAPTGTTTANAAIIPAGANGSVSVYASADTEVVIDINGYFAPPGTNGNYFYTVPPCRTLDTRQHASGPGNTASVAVNLSSCAGRPSARNGFVFNTTVVPVGPLTFLTVWPDGQARPLVSTLNADANTITSNMAIVPSTNGIIDAYSTGQTYMIFDLFGYFAP